VGGYSSSATLLGAIRVLWTEQMQLVAAAVFLFTILLPAVELGALLYVTLSLRGGRPPGFDHLLRAVGAGAALGHDGSADDRHPHHHREDDQSGQGGGAAGLFAFGALTLMLAIVVSFDPKILWNIGEHLPGPRRPAQQRMKMARAAAGLP
jgi:paraquat-inducible protein A